MFIVLFWLFLSACEPTIQVLPSITETTTITNTSSATYTRTQTITPTITDTKIPSKTFTPSFTPTITITNSPTLTRSPFERFYETKGEIPFSYVPPRDWVEISSEFTSDWVFGEAFGPHTSGCALSFEIIFNPNTSAYNYSEWYRLGEVLQSGKFYPYAGYDAYRLSIRLVAGSGDGEVTYYLIYNGEYLIIAQYERLWSTFREQDSIVDNSMKTIQFEK
jgi:hypothetical protein